MFTVRMNRLQVVYKVYIQVNISNQNSWMVYAFVNKKPGENNLSPG